MTLHPGGEIPQLIDGPTGQIETIRMLPKAESATDLAVVCHPHSLMGGSMQNKVVHTVARAHRDASHLAVRFNFRGVGKSEGQYADGIGECDDLLSVLDWSRTQCPQGRLFLAGFSFGSFVAARTAQFLAPRGHILHHLLLIAPPVHHYEFQTLAHFPCPVTVIMGENDEVVPADEVYRWFDTITSKKRIVRIPGASHFFHGMLHEVKAGLEPDIK